MSIDIKFPSGRLVDGSLYEPQTTDAEGKPLVIKSGPNAGKSTVKFYFAVAYAKAAAHWANEEWGKAIWALGHSSWPQGQAQAPTFAWKITDGDSAVPNKRGRAPNSREGFPSSWVVSFSSSFAPKVCNTDGSAYILEKDAVNLGDYVEVLGSIASNESPNQPGVYINHKMVALAGYGKRIVVGVNPASVGFGRGPLPAGASTTPLSGGLPSAPPAPVAAPPVPVAPVAAALPPPAPPVAPVAVAPAPAFMAPPPPPAAPGPAFPDVGKVMIGAAAGTQYSQWIAAGWTDAQLVSSGKMAA